MPQRSNKETGIAPNAGSPSIGGGGSIPADRYHIDLTLKEGRGTKTFLATELSSGDRVVVKAVSTEHFSAGTRMRLEHEASLLRQVRSRWLAPLFDVRRDDGTLYLVAPYVVGRSLQKRLADGPLDVRETLTLGCCLFSALKDIHEHRVLHRDVKPASIIVDDGVPLSGATLVDFGPARAAMRLVGASQTSLHQRSVESVLYMSPEQTGSIDHDVAEPADLYSAGVLLFECLAGRPPFGGDTVGAVLFEHMTVPVPELRGLRRNSRQGSIPRALDEVVQRLLRKDPRDRYQSAEAVLADLQAISDALDRGEQEPSLVVGAQDRRCTLTEPAFVARKDELQQFDEHFRQASAGNGGLVLLEAESGGGKTRLLTETAQRGVRDGFWVLRGQGSSDVGQQPYRLLDGIVEGFVSVARVEPELAECVKRRLETHRDAITAALPKLALALGWTTSKQSAPEAFGEQRSIRALADFLDALGTAQRPAVIVLDDCQWADELTCKLIGRWHARAKEKEADGTAASDRHVVLIAAFRSEEVSAGHLLRTLEPASHLCLQPFAPEDIGRLIESMAGPLPDRAVEAVVRLAEGSPFMASAVLRGMVESEILVSGPDGWRIEPEAMADLHSSDRAATFLSRRIDLLPEQTIMLLSVGAVLGKEFDLDTGAQLARQEPSQVIDALDEARRRHLVWAGPDGSRCVFVHDKIRSTLLDRLSNAQRQGIHYRAAKHLQEHAPERVSDLAYHFDAAGQSDFALSYALEAAAQARSQHALEVAAQQYRIARRGAQQKEKRRAESGSDRVGEAPFPAPLSTLRYEIAEGLGEVLMLRGRYQEAAEVFKEAATLAQTLETGGRVAQAKIRGKLGELAFKRGNIEAAIQDFEAALRLLGRTVPRGMPSFMVLLVREVVMQALHTLFPALFVHRCKKMPSEARLLEVRLFSRLAHGYWFARSQVISFWAHLRGLNLAERYPPTLELAQAYSEHAPAMTLIPWFNRGISYARKSYEIRKSFGDLWGQGQSLAYHGIALYGASRFTECIVKCREAIRLLERTGDYWEVHIARYQLAASLYHLGDLQGAVEESRRNYRSGLELGDEQASGIILDVWARAAGGAVPADILDKELERKREDAQGIAEILLAEGMRHLGRGNPDKAAAVFEKAIHTASRAGVNNAWTLPNYAWLATARRRMAERRDDYTPTGRQELLRKAESAARRAVRAARVTQNDLPQALREYALVSAMRGKTGRARRLFDRSLALADRQEARYEFAETLLCRGRVGKECGWPEAEGQIAEARAILCDLDVDPLHEESLRPAKDDQVSLSLADRFATVLDSGRKIASALSMATIYDEVRAAAQRILRGERCLLLQIDPKRDGQCLIPVAGEAPLSETVAPIDERIVYRSLETGRAVGSHHGAEAANAPNDGVVASDEHSSLCVPLFVRGHAIAFLYVIHQHVRGLFGPDEERLAEFIATIAGAALENAEGFQELQRLNETLEQRVTERTKAAEARAQELTVSNMQLKQLATELRQTEEQLHVAIDAAEAASRAKSRFLATVSHEIRTPMNGILGMTELALNTSLSEQQRNYLTTVELSAKSLLELLNDILDFSKIEAGKMELESVAFDVREVVGDTAKLLAVGASQKGLELDCRIGPDVPSTTIGDPSRLRQILTNLLGNAVKFTERGEVVVDVSLDKADDSRVTLLISVRDTGIGIPPDKQACIFESFRQSDSSTTRRFGGTGLGLAICSQLVDLMNGRIWVESQEGLGCTFYFTVPLQLPEKTTAADETQVGHAPAETDQEEPRPIRSLHVLLAEDGPVNQEVAAGLLELRGHTVEVVDNGKEAVDALARGPFDVVLMDIEMPQMDGLQATAAIRDREERSGGHTPIVAMTAHAVKGFREQCLAAGMDGYVSKPIQPAELFEALDELCGEKADASGKQKAESGA